MAFPRSTSQNLHGSEERERERAGSVHAALSAIALYRRISLNATPQRQIKRGALVKREPFTPRVPFLARTSFSIRGCRARDGTRIVPGPRLRKKCRHLRSIPAGCEPGRPCCPREWPLSRIRDRSATETAGPPRRRAPTSGLSWSRRRSTHAACTSRCNFPAANSNENAGTLTIGDRVCSRSRKKRLRRSG